MKIVEKIDDIYEKMQTLPLSKIVSLILPISLEFKDYEGYCILFLWNTPIKKTNGARKDLIDTFKREGIEADKLDNIEAEALKTIISMRTVDKDKNCTLSIMEIENTIKNYDEMIDAVEVPEGLNPLDLYYRSKTATNQKLEIITQRQLMEGQLAVLYSFLTSKLATYRHMAVAKERKLLMETNIKNTKDVFIIHGHNEAKLLELEKMMKEQFSLNPIILKDKPNSGLTIIEKFEKYSKQCSYAFALFTPDDIVTGKDGKQYFQMRPNVIFELGWFYAHLGRSRVCILEQASEKSEIFSDLQGVMRIQFNKNIDECFLEIQRELQSIGII